MFEKRGELMSDIYNEKTIHKSRKDHRCDICGETIQKGVSYKNIRGLFDGHFFETKVCNHCIPILDKFIELNRDNLDDGYRTEEVSDDVMETVRYDCKGYNECISNCVTCDWGIKKYLEYESEKFWK